MKLQDLYGDLAASLPTDPDRQDKAVVFDAESVPSPRAQMETADLSILRSSHLYGPSLCVDMAYVFATPEVYRQLGLLSLGVLFHHDIDVVDLSLIEPVSEVKVVRIRYDAPDKTRFSPEYSPYSHDYVVLPLASQYWVSSDRGHRPTFPPENQPEVLLSTAKGEDERVPIPSSQKTHLIVSTDHHGKGLAEFADLLLDLGAPQEHQSFDLEMPGAMGSDDPGAVTFGSTELRLHLSSDPASDSQVALGWH